ncbi:MAG: hypothetical protein U9Q67_04655 [Patescibacteria group bacterium]|nr:hypothetical protein [Patescibacteria group bacterium]
MEYVVVKLGGSLVSPVKKVVDMKLVDDYVKKIRKLVSMKDSPRLILVIGGGNTSRMYRDVSEYCKEDSEVDKHRVGITATWLNAELVRSLLDDVSFRRVLGVGVYADDRAEGESRVAKDFESWLSGDKAVLVSGGFINGASTDLNAILLASKIGVEQVFKLTDIDYVYTSDPDKDAKAKKMENFSWDEYFRIFDSTLEKSGQKLKHDPGQHIPVDLLAARLASENNVSVHVVKGDNSDILEDIFADKPVKGSFIHP